MYYLLPFSLPGHEDFVLYRRRWNSGMERLGNESRKESRLCVVTGGAQTGSQLLVSSKICRPYPYWREGEIVQLRSGSLTFK